MADELLAGNSAEASLYGDYDKVYLSKFQAIKNGLCSSLSVRFYKGSFNGYAKVAIYSDNAGSVADRIAYSDTEVTISGTGYGWVTCPFSEGCVIESGKYYWLAVITRNNYAFPAYSSSSGGTVKYSVQDGDTWTWPSSIDASGWSDGTQQFSIYALGTDTGETIPVLMVGDLPYGVDNRAGGYTQYRKFTALASGDVTHIAVYTQVAGNVKVAIYDDDSGPNNLLGKKSASTAVVIDQWNLVELESSASVTLGSDYWIGVCYDNTGAATSFSDTGGVVKLKTETFATFDWSNPAELTDYSDGTRIMCYSAIGAETEGWTKIKSLPGISDVSRIKSRTGVLAGNVKSITGVSVT